MQHDLPSLRTMRLNIWRGVLAATEQEIHDGVAFYPGAHGLCRLFAAAHPPATARQVAGIYAALSPMNGWDQNVANTLDVLRFDRPGARLTVNTSHANAAKAIAIASGADPEEVLKGRKVRAFFRAIADPEDRQQVPVDRHLIRLATGADHDNASLSRVSGNGAFYDRIEGAYLDLGAREGIGNRLASIAWFVQRRIAAGARPLLTPSRAVCCGEPMVSHGHKPRRFRCTKCGRSRHASPRVKRISARHPPIPPLGPTETQDRRGRVRRYLGKGHPAANSAGWQYRARLVVEEALGRRLSLGFHVHHANPLGNRADDRLEFLEVMAADYHGQCHGSAAVIYRTRDASGRFEFVGEGTFDWPRLGPILGPAAKEGRL